MGRGRRQGPALTLRRPGPESPARAVVGGIRAARPTGGPRRSAPLTRSSLTPGRAADPAPAPGLDSRPGCVLGGARGADTVAFRTHGAAGRQKARARGSVWSRICALGGHRAGSGVPAEGLHFPEDSGTLVPVLGAPAEQGEGTAGLSRRPRNGDHSPPDRSLF